MEMSLALFVAITETFRSGYFEEFWLVERFTDVWSIFLDVRVDGVNGPVHWERVHVRFDFLEPPAVVAEGSWDLLGVARQQRELAFKSLYRMCKTEVKIER